MRPDDFTTFTKEQLEAFGPPKKAEEFRTLRRVYETPFMYENVEVGNFTEFKTDKGMELTADKGFITIKEEKPIVAVTIVGSGCLRRGYNIVEWWDDGEDIDNINDTLIKRQRVDNLNGLHPSVWMELLRNAPRKKGHTFEGDSGGEFKDAADAIRKLTHDYYYPLDFGLYENTTYFRVGARGVYPNKITVRGGCKDTEDPGMSIERYPAEYAFRLIETTVIDK